MPAVFDSGCLSSTVKNTSGGRMRFGFLPPHGKELAANEEITVFGSIYEAVNRGDRFGKRSMDALEKALQTDLLEIVSTPSPILYDEVLDQRRMLYLENGVLSLQLPCWETSFSSQAHPLTD